MNNQTVNTLSVLASFVIPGLGQFGKGHFGRGILIFLGAILCLFSIMILVGIVLLPVYWIWNMIDAYKLEPKE